MIIQSPRRSPPILVPSPTYTKSKTTVPFWAPTKTNDASAQSWAHVNLKSNATGLVEMAILSGCPAPNRGEFLGFGLNSGIKKKNRNQAETILYIPLLSPPLINIILYFYPCYCSMLLIYIYYIYFYHFRILLFLE